MTYVLPDLSLDPHSAEPLYAQLARRLRAGIAAGHLGPGDALPPVRTLAESVRCTPGTVARAYTVLADEGLIVGRRGSGTHVAEAATARPWLREAHLVNSLEHHLLDALAQGYTPAEIEAAFGLALARWRGMTTSDTISAPTPDVELTFAGSHDLSIEALFRLLGRAPRRVQTAARFVGSLGGLMAVAEGRADVAGVHLLDETGEYNAPYVRRLLPGRRVALVNVVTRLVGWMVAPRNPLVIHSWDDISRPGLRLVNRQRGSGTRVLLDRQLERLALRGDCIAGYQREETTHLGVAQAVADGEADLGLGIYAAARATGLDFVPLVEEPYDLVIPAEIEAAPATQSLLTTLRGAEFHAVVEAMGGYRTEGSGRVTWL